MKAIVVPTFNRKEVLRRFLNNLAEQTVQPDVIVVVNDGSSDGTDQMLSNEYPHVIQVKGKGDWWWTGSVNRGIEYLLEHKKEVDGIIMQNDDTRIDKDWFANIVAVAEANPNALIGCVAVSEDAPDRISYAGRTKNKWLAIAKKFHVGKKLSDFPADTLIPSFDLIGRGCYIPVKVFNEIGLYDEIHFKHRGDTELPLRARKAGYQLLISFKPVVYINLNSTSYIGLKEYTLSDFKAKFFDFRSSSYWKYRYYYAKTLADNKLQHYSFFAFRMLWHFVAYVTKLKYFKFLMKKSYASVMLLFFMSHALTAFSQNDTNARRNATKTLCAAYADYFPIGAAVIPEIDLVDNAKVALLKKQFCSLTSKEAMQPHKIQKQEGVFRWDEADMLVNFAQANHLKVRGHCLVYYSHMPKWFFIDNGAAASKELLLQRLKTHITKEVSRYKGKVYCWDVVNEAVSERRGETFRSSDPIYQIVGEEYVEKAFEYAHAADPGAKLFYNDSFVNDRFEKAYRFLKKLKAKGVPIDGVGIQGHWDMRGINEGRLQKMIDMFSSLGLEVQITELDVSIYESSNPDEVKYASEENTTFIQRNQAEIYKQIFDVCRRNKGKVTGITFWGIADGPNHFLVKRLGKKNYPFLFDTSLSPKSAFSRVINF